MGYILQDKLEISLFFSGEEFKIDAYNVLSFLQIDLSIKQILPQLTMAITDASMVLSQKGLLKDGGRVSVVLKPMGSATSTTYNFRIFKFREVKTVTGARYQIDAIYDNIKYWLTTTNIGARGTSRELMEHVAYMCSFRSDMTDTADDQLWTPNNSTYGIWAKRIARHGYASDRSLMVHGVDIINNRPTLLYKDFNSIKSKPLNIAIGNVGAGEISCVDFRVNANSGAGNKNAGYNMSRQTQSAMGAKDVVANDKMEFTPDSRSPLFSLDVKEKAERGSVSYSGIDFGNTNPNSYERGRYINARSAALLSAKIDVMAIMPTNVRLLDRINVVARNETKDRAVDSSWSGVYTVTSVSYRIENTNYCEVVEGYRHGTNLPQGS